MHRKCAGCASDHRNRGYGDQVTLAAAPLSPGADFVIEDLTTGAFASGFGRLGDGRSFSFHVYRAHLVVEVYRPRLAGVVPLPEDIVATAERPLGDLDVDDARSLTAAVRDTVASAAPVR